MRQAVAATAAELGLGRGDAVPEARRVTLANWQIGPWNRWAFQRVSQIVAVAPISRGNEPIAALPRAPRDLSGLIVSRSAGGDRSVADLLDATFTDGIVVLKESTVVFERYLNGLEDGTRHLLMSVSKSIVGALAGVLVQDGRLDVGALVPRYVPELSQSAYADATVQQVLDMQVSVQFSEDYEDPASEVQMQDRCANWRPRLSTDPEGSYQLLTGLQRSGEHGQVFQYCSATTDVLGWVLERAGGLPLPVMLSREIWAKLGAEHDAEITVDSCDAPFANGGICVTLRDLARFGQMMMQDGWFNGRQIVPATWVDDIRRNGDNGAWSRSGASAETMYPRGWYRDKWWVANDDDGCFYGSGIHGQHVWVNPARRVVIAKLSTHPAPLDLELYAVTHATFNAIAHALD